MAVVITSEDIDLFLKSANNAEARTRLGVTAGGGGSIGDLAPTLDAVPMANGTIWEPLTPEQLKSRLDLSNVLSFVGPNENEGSLSLNNFTSSAHVGDGTTTAFTLSFAPRTEIAQAFVVGIDGVLQSPIDAYTVSRTTGLITFSSAPPVNSKIVVTTSAAVTGYDISDTTVTATGSTTTRKLVDRFADTVNVKDFGAVGDGVTDDTVAIQAAIDYACGLTDVSVPTTVGKGNIVVDLTGGLYALSGTVRISRNIQLKNGALVALSNFTVGEFMLVIEAGAEMASVTNVNFDGGLNVSTNARYADLIQVLADRCKLDNILGIHFPNYGIRYTSCQEAVTSRVVLREWAFLEAGTADDTLRTAKAFSIEDADAQFADCIGAQSLYPFYVSGALNSFVACHAYNGGATNVGASEAVAFYIDGANNNMLTGCYLDNGSLYIKDSFKQNISGTHFQRTGAGTNNSGIYLDTSATGEDIAGLNVIGCTFNGSHSDGEITFNGTGTYVSDIFKKITWAGNQQSEGEPAWKDTKFGVSSYAEYGASYFQSGASGAYDIKTTKSLRLSADYDANSSPSDSKIIFATNGADCLEVRDGGALVPSVDVTSSLGDSTHRYTTVFSNRVSIIDGVTAPSVLAGHASIYVDSADGDLKIIFGDGTIKTISTDT